MENFLLTTLCVIQDLKFTPLVLIGLMITSLSLILNLKDANIYLFKFKKQSNIKVFVKKTYTTILLLIVIFLISMVSNYLLPININNMSNNEYISLSIISLLFFILLILIIKNIISISFVIKEIVLSSLQED